MFFGISSVKNSSLFYIEIKTLYYYYYYYVKASQKLMEDTHKKRFFQVVR